MDRTGTAHRSGRAVWSDDKFADDIFGSENGQTAQGAVWLNADMLPVYDYWQFWRNTEDGDIARFLRLFTELPETEIARLAKLEGAELNDAKKVLATEATAMCHGAMRRKKPKLQRAKLSKAAAKVLICQVCRGTGQLDTGIGLLEAFVLAGLAGSNGEARRLVQGGGARINDAAQNDIARTLTQSDLKDGVIKLSAGKKRHVLLVPEG